MAHVRKALSALISITFLIQLSSALEWEWQNPIPNASNICYGQALSANKVLRSNGEGGIMSTLDDGKTWHTGQFPSGQVMYGMFFVNAKTGWVSCASGNIYKTLDGGETWFMQATLGGSARNIFFVDSLVGWVYTPSLYKIWKTTNGGENWTAHEGPTSMVMRGLHFANRHAGAAVGDDGYALYTRDGGLQWDNIYVREDGRWTPSLVDVHLVTSKVGWAISNPGGGVFKTTDGGMSWKKQSMPFYCSYSDVFFLDSLTGWLAGNGGIVARTVDGGKTWSKSFAPSRDHINRIHFIEKNVGWAFGWAGAIHKTVDGGVTWQAKRKGFHENLHSVFFHDEQNGWAVGERGKIVHTSNGGQLWDSISIGFPGRLYTVCFPTPTQGWISGNLGMILKTTDGGNTWEKRPLEDSTWLPCMHFVDANHGWAGSDSGKILRTKDGGETWEKLFVGYHHPIRSIRFYDRNLGLAGADSGIIFRTSNGGDKWERKRLAFQNTPLCIRFVNSSVVWAVGREHAYISTTGGNAWKEMRISEPRAGYYAVSFDDSSLGLIASTFGIHETANGGADWVKNRIGTSHFRAMHFPTRSTGWAVGDNGAIVKFTKAGTGIRLAQNHNSRIPAGARMSHANPGIDGIRLFDIRGRIVETLAPGLNHRPALPTGVYFLGQSGRLDGPNTLKRVTLVK